MSARAAFAAAVAGVLGLALVPWTDGPLRRLAGEGESRPSPRFDVPLEIDDLLVREPRVRDGATYLTDASGRTPLEQGNLKAIGQLYLSRALPVQDPTRADWVLSLRGDEVTLGRAR